MKILSLELKLNVPLKRVTFEGRVHLVAPVVALVTGVHNRLFYPADELAKYPESWNGVPLPIFHPNVDGANVSANSPELIEQQSVGRLFHMNYDAAEEKLRGEIWVDEAKALEIAPNLLTMLNAGDPLEVSTALFCDEVRRPGSWNGEEYDAIAANIRPDHLALLPGGEGACNWKDGCGVRANEGKDDMKTQNWRPATPSVLRRVFQSLARAIGFRGLEPSHGDIRDLIYMALEAELPIVPGAEYPSVMCWIREVYDDRVIYAIEKPGAETELYERGYSVGAGGELTLASDAVQVREETSYVPVDEPTGNAKEEEPMGKKDEAVKALIANKRTRFEAKDEAWLTALTEEQLATLEPTCPDVKTNEPETPATPPAAEVPATPPAPPAAPPPADEEKPVTVEDYIASAPGEVREVLTRALALDRARKDELVKSLLANKRNKFAENALRGKGLDELEALAALADVPVDYSGRVGGRPVENESAVPDMPKVFEKV